MHSTQNMNPHCIIREERHKQTALAAVEGIKPSQKNPTAVFIGEWKETRTQKQNRYLWGWVYANIVEKLNESGQVIQCRNGREMEWTKDLLHEAFKLYRKLAPVETAKGIIELFESTAKMDKQRFSAYIDDIRKACWGWWNITIPEPIGIWLDYHREIYT